MQPLSMNQSKTNKNRRNAALFWRVWAFLFALILLVTAINFLGIARADEEPVATGESEEPGAAGAAEEPGKDQPVNGNGEDEPVVPILVDCMWSADSAGNPMRKWSIGYGGTIGIRIFVTPSYATDKRVRWKADTEETRIGLYLDEACTQRIYPGDPFSSDATIYIKALVDREEHCVIKFESLGNTDLIVECEIDITASPSVGSGESPQTGDFNWQLLSLMMLIAAVTVATVVMVRNAVKRKPEYCHKEMTHDFL